MIPTTLKTEIFKSIPKTVTMGTDNITVKAEYADKMVVPPADTEYPYITLAYFADTKDEGASSLNQVMDTELVDVGGGNKDVKTTLGKRKRVTLSLHCHATDKTVGANKYHHNDIVDKMLSDLEIWAMKDLPAVLEAQGAVQVAEQPIPRMNLIQGEATAHAVLDVIIRYPLTYQVQDTTIETIIQAVNEG